MTDILHLKEKLAQACRVIGLLDLTKATTGHLSLRIPGTDKVLIRARGDFESGVRYTAADDIITVDLQGRKLEGRDDLDPPREVYIHTWLYRTRPGIGAVVHAHPPTLVLFTVCKKPLLPIYGGYDPSSLRMLMEGVPTYPRSVTVTNDTLGEEFAQAMGTRACLMRGHGITTCGGDVEDAALTTIKLNHLAEMNFRAYQLGDPEPIPDDDIAAFSKSRTVKDNAPVWTYYCKLVGEDAI
ncbi:MAG: class II aldolase/adducin family protein [Alphaproteobacteria bacterium]|nr:class II aldolase/adducin family protein [Alphaproteobacteria bacterium]